MKVQACGDRLWIVSELEGSAWAVARWLERNPLHGMVECVAAYDTVGLHVNPAKFQAHALRDWLSNWEPDSVEPTHHIIPVCFELGMDWETVFQKTRLTKESAVATFCSADFRCAAIGFCPGFPYLTGLPEPLCGLPRLSSPRVRVPAGSVGITGNQAGIYPDEVPGGWNVLGLTPLVICDPTRAEFPIEPGDVVRFLPVTEPEYQQLKGQSLCRPST